MKMRSQIKKLFGMVAVLITMAALMFQPATVAYADDPYLDSNAPSAKMTDKDIEAMNQHEIAWLISQNQVIRDSYQLEADFQDLIDLMVTRHGDAPDLDIALGRYDTAFLVAQSVHDNAAKIIGAQYGFDAQGHVTNREAALQTVTDARYYLRDAHYRLLVAIRALHKDYAAWHYKLIHSHDK